MISLPDLKPNLPIKDSGVSFERAETGEIECFDWWVCHKKI
ncbi:MAG: hypothetical protein ACXQTF_02985 [Candidatus Hecatellaceae archaeon]